MTTAVKYVRFDAPVAPTIVCLCGSTRFAEDMNEAARFLTTTGDGCIVVRPEVVTYSQAEDPQIHDAELKAKLDVLHLRKIDLADYVLIVCPGGYIGESTTEEIVYTLNKGKHCLFVEDVAMLADEDYRSLPWERDLSNASKTLRKNLDKTGLFWNIDCR